MAFSESCSKLHESAALRARCSSTVCISSFSSTQRTHLAHRPTCSSDRTHEFPKGGCTHHTASLGEAACNSRRIHRTIPAADWGCIRVRCGSAGIAHASQRTSSCLAVQSEEQPPKDPRAWAAGLTLTSPPPPPRIDMGMQRWPEGEKKMKCGAIAHHMSRKQQPIIVSTRHSHNTRCSPHARHPAAPGHTCLNASRNRRRTRRTPCQHEPPCSCCCTLRSFLALRQQGIVAR